MYSILVDVIIDEDADDKTTASLLFVMAANSGFGVIIGNNDEGVHPPGENASTNIMNIGTMMADEARQKEDGERDPRWQSPALSAVIRSYHSR